MISDVPINGVIIKLIHLVFNILLIHTSLFLWIIFIIRALQNNSGNKHEHKN